MVMDAYGLERQEPRSLELEKIVSTEFGLHDQILSVEAAYQRYAQQRIDNRRGDPIACGGCDGVAKAFYWELVGQDRCCTGCGSLHPEDFEAILDDAVKPDSKASVDPSDKGYKIYAHRAGVTNAGNGGIKFYGWHYPDADAKARIIAKIRPAAVASHNRLYKGATP